MTAAGGGHMMPDTGGIIEAGTEGYTVRVSVQNMDLTGTETVSLTLDYVEARMLGRWLLRLSNEARRGK